MKTKFKDLKNGDILKAINGEFFVKRELNSNRYNCKQLRYDGSEDESDTFMPDTNVEKYFLKEALEEMNND